MIQVFSNSLGEDEARAVREVFESGWTGKGKKVDEFEKEFGAYVGSRYCIGVSSCTHGLILALQAVGVGAGDEVIIPSIHFVGAANAICSLGAKPVFADVDTDTLNILPIEVDKKFNPGKTKAVMTLNYAGYPCRADEIRRRARRNELKVISDEANSISSSLYGQHTSKWADIGVFSFDSMKQLVTVEGGAIVTEDQKLADNLRTLSYMGMKKGSTSGTDSAKEGNSRWWEFQVQHPFANRYIWNDVAASVGLIQLKKLPGFIKRRERIAERYLNGLMDIKELTVAGETPYHIRHSHYLYPVRTYRRDELAKCLLDNGIYTTFRYFPLHHVNAYKCTDTLMGANVVSENYLNLPMHQNLTNNDVDTVIKVVRRFFK